MRARRDGRRSDQEPSTEALAAMAEAARRSRQSGVGIDDARTNPEGPTVPRPRSAPPANGAAPVRPDNPRRRSFLIVSVVLVVVLAALVGWTSTRGHGAPTPHAAPGPPLRGPAPIARSSSRVPPVKSAPSTHPPSSSSTTAAPPPTTTQTTTPTTTSTTSPTGGAPVLSAVQPASGAAGQVVVITGTNLISQSGQITAHVGAQVALIACPEPTSCLVDVPAATGTGTSAPLTVTTDSGTSNPLTFTYG